MRSSGLLAALSLLLVAALPPPPSFVLKQEPYEYGIQELCFPSGLRVTVISDFKAPVVGVTAVVNRGSASDPAGQSGAAHLLEHLWFQARPDGGRPVHERLRHVGAEHNAYTTQDATVYMTLAPIEVLDELLALEAARLADPLSGVDAGVVEAERSVVNSERVGWGSLTHWQAMELLSDQMFPPEHPYHDLEPTFGQSIPDITLEQLSVLAADYRPDQVTLMITGAVTVTTVQRMVEEAFPEALLFQDAEGGYPETGACGGRVSPQELEPVQATPPLKTRILPTLEERSLLLGWRLPPGYGPDEAATRIAVAVVWVQLKLNLKQARGVSCDYFPNLHGSVAFCGITLDQKDDPEAVYQAAQEALERADLSDVLTEALFDRGRFRVRSAIFRSIEEISALYSREYLGFALYNHTTGSPLYYSEALTALDAVTVTDFEARYDRWLRGDQAFAVVLSPDEIGPVEAEEVSQEAALEGARDEDVAVFADVAAHARSSGWSTEPPTAAAPTVDVLDEVRTLTLDNGLKVVLLHHGQAPLVRVALGLEGGPALEPSVGVDALTWALTWFDIESLEHSLSESIASIAGQVGWADAQDGSALVLSASSGNVEDALYLMRVVAEGAQLFNDQYARDWVEERQKRDWEWLADKPAYWAARARHLRLLGDRGRDWGEQLWVGLGERNGRKLNAWHQRRWRPDSATLYVIGRLSMSTEQQVRAALEGWEVKGERAPAAPAAAALPAPGPREVLLLDEPDATRSEVALSCPPGPPDAAARQALIRVLEGLGWDRLREGDLAAYQHFAWLTGDEDGPAVASLQVRVAPEQAGEAAQTLLQIVADVGSGREEGAAAWAIHEVQQQWPLKLVTTSDLMQQLWRFGGSTGEIERMRQWPERLAAVTPADIAGQLAGCIGHESLTIIGSAEQTRQSTEGVGLSPAAFDWQQAARQVRSRSTPLPGK